MKRTPNINLPQFEETDRYRLEDYNEAYSIIDKEISDIGTQLDSVNASLDNNENKLNLLYNTELNINLFEGATKEHKLINMIKYACENDYKKVFEDKFIKRFYYREIGFETITRFLINLESTLNEIMPYYKHLYQTTTYIYDPLLNYDVTESITREIVGETIGENNVSHENTIDNTNRVYDTPIIKTSDPDYYKKSPALINDTLNTNNINSSGTNKNNNRSSEVNKRNTKGNIGVMTSQDLILKERSIIINLDSLILDELEILFMQVF